MTNQLHGNHKFVTVCNRCSKIALSTAMHSATHIWKSCFVRQTWCLRFFMWAATSKMQMSSSSCVFTFLLLFIQPHNKNLMLQGRGRDEECAPDSNCSKWVTIQNYTFFSQKLILLPSKILAFPPESPCIRYHCTKFSCQWPGTRDWCFWSWQFVSENAKVLHHQNQQGQKQYPQIYQRLQENQETVFRSNLKCRSQWSKRNDVYDIQGSSLLRCDVSLGN